MAERPASERHEWQIPLSQGEIDRCGSIPATGVTTS
jgi:hypothetical protein